MIVQKLCQITLFALVLGTLGFTQNPNLLYIPVVLQSASVGCRHATPTQPKNADLLAFPAEQFCQITDPDQDGNRFAIADGDTAQGWYVVKAPAQARSEMPAALNESQVVYRVQFSEAGQYSLHLRLRASTKNADSLFIPLDFGVDPTKIIDIDDSGRFVWQTMPVLYEVTSEDIGRELEVRIGSRERNSEIDSLAFVKAGAVDSALRLDAALGAYEAENATLANVQVVSDPNASDQESITPLWKIGSSIDFGYVRLADRLTIRYSLQPEMAKQVSVYVNNIDVATVQFISTGSWNSYATTFVYLPEAGIVRLQIDPDDYTVNLKDKSAAIDGIAVDSGVTGEGGQEQYFTDTASLASALAEAQPGDTLVLANGDYFDQGLNIAASGTPTRPITLRAQTAGEVKFHGSSALNISGSYIVVDGLSYMDPVPSPYADTHTNLITMGGSAHYNRLTNISITNFNVSTATNVNAAGKAIIFRWLYMTGTQNQVDHSYFSNKPDLGPVIYLQYQGPPTYNVITHNYFERRWHRNWNGAETIALVNKTNDPNAPMDTVVKYNLFFKCDGEGECISNKSTENYYFYNSLRDSTGWLVLRDGNKAWIEGNNFMGGIGGIRVHGSDHVIINNHFENLDAGLLLAGGQPDLASNSTCYDPVNRVVIANNTFAEVKSSINFQEKSCGDQAGDVLPFMIAIANNLVSGGDVTIHQTMAGSLHLAQYNNVTTLSDIPAGWTVPNFSQPEQGPGLHHLRLGVDSQRQEVGPVLGRDKVGANPDFAKELNWQNVGPRWGVRIAPG